MPHMLMTHDTDAKDILLKELGSVDDFEITDNQVLCAVYIRPEKTKGGILLPGATTEEDKYQSKVGLIVRLGPSAFVDESGKWFKDMTFSLHDWAVFSPSDGWNITVNGILCRVLKDTNIRGRVQAADMVW